MVKSRGLCAVCTRKKLRMKQRLAEKQNKKKLRMNQRLAEKQNKESLKREESENAERKIDIEGKQSDSAFVPNDGRLKIIKKNGVFSIDMEGETRTEDELSKLFSLFVAAQRANMIYSAFYSM